MIKDDNATCSSKSLDEVDALRIVFVLNLAIIQEAGMLRRLSSKLKSGNVEFVKFILTAHVLDVHVMRVLDPVTHPLPRDAVCIDVMVRPRAVRWSKVVVEGAGSVERHDG